MNNMLQRKLIDFEGIVLVRYVDRNYNIYYDEFGERLDKELMEILGIRKKPEFIKDKELEEMWKEELKWENKYLVLLWNLN